MRRLVILALALILPAAALRAFDVIGTIPGRGSETFLAYDTLMVIFDEAPDGNTVEDGVVIGGVFRDYIPDWTEISGDTLKLFPEWSWMAGDRITVQLTTELASEGGAVLAEPYEFSFHVTPAGGSYDDFDPPVQLGTDLVHALAPADFDHDGYTDLVLALSNRIGVSRNRRDSDMPFRTGRNDLIWYNTIPAFEGERALLATDLDGDGFPDLAINDYWEDRLYIYENLSSGPGDFDFGTRRMIALEGSRPVAMAAADLNGDLLQEIAVIFEGSDQLIILGQSGFFDYQQDHTFSIGTGPSAIIAEDLNADGLTDLAVAYKGEDVIDVFWNRSGYTFEQASVTTLPGGVDGLIAANVSGFTDGEGTEPQNLDLIAWNRGSEQLDENEFIVTVRNYGDETFGNAVGRSFYTRPYTILMANLQPDPERIAGRYWTVSSLITNISDDRIEIFQPEMTGGFSLDNTLTAPRQMIAFDCDRDGDMDLLVNNWAPGVMRGVHYFRNGWVPPDFSETYTLDFDTLTFQRLTPAQRLFNPRSATPIDTFAREELTITGNNPNVVRVDSLVVEINRIVFSIGDSLTDGSPFNPDFPFYFGPGDTFTIPFDFAPVDTMDTSPSETGRWEGHARLLRSIRSDSGWVQAEPIYILLYGRGGRSILEATPQTLDFGAIEGGEQLQRNFLVMDAGNFGLDARFEADDLAPFSFSGGLQDSILPGAYLDYIVEFTPPVVADTTVFQRTIKVYDARFEGYPPGESIADTLLIQLTGTALPPPPPNHLPVFTFPVDDSVYEGTDKTLTVTFMDPDSSIRNLRCAVTGYQPENTPVTVNWDELTTEEFRDSLRFEFSLDLFQLQDDFENLTIAMRAYDAQYPDSMSDTTWTITLVRTEIPLPDMNVLELEVVDAGQTSVPLREVTWLDTGYVVFRVNNIGRAPMEQPFTVRLTEEYGGQTREVFPETVISPPYAVGQVLDESDIPGYPFRWTSSGVGTHTFHLEILPGDNLEETLENNSATWTIEHIFQAFEVYPKPFTPNGDGFNDVCYFDFRDDRVRNPVVKIFTMDGMLLVSLTDMRDNRIAWDGVDLLGRRCLPGVYLFTVADGGKKLNSGMIYLVR